MKKVLVTTLITTALAVSVLAQGTVSLPLSSSSRYIQYTTDGTTLVKFPSGSPATAGTWGSLNIAVYYASAGTASPLAADRLGPMPSAWKQSANVLKNLYGAGVNLATTFTLQSAAGASSQQVLVVGWTGSFADWNTAFAAGTGLMGYTGSTLSGGALSWANGTGDPNGTPPSTPVALVTGAAGYNGLVLTVVPEPSLFALAGLGLSSLLIFRRRK